MNDFAPENETEKIRHERTFEVRTYIGYYRREREPIKIRCMQLRLATKKYLLCNIDDSEKLVAKFHEPRMTERN